MCCYKYWGNIREISQSLGEYGTSDFKSCPLDKAMPLLDDVEVIAHDKTIDFDSAKHILDNEEMNNALKTIRRFYVDMGTNLEVHNAQDILESEDPWAKLESFHFFRRYEKLVSDEGHLAQFLEGDKVVFIGGGPLPLTLILFNKFFGVKGISVEVIPEIADLSRKVLDKLGLSSQIEVICGDETELSHLNYDAVMVAAFAEPKYKVFTTVKNCTDTETKILYRTYTGMRAILYSPITEESLSGFEEIGRVFPTGKVNNTSVLIKKASV
jgi:protein-L-isoaspartate O-methyltransferase